MHMYNHLDSRSNPHPRLVQAPALYSPRVRLSLFLQFGVEEIASSDGGDVVACRRSGVSGFPLVYLWPIVALEVVSKSLYSYGVIPVESLQGVREVWASRYRFTHRTKSA